MSAAPPIASISTATPSITAGAYDASIAATPKPIIANPHTRIATITARPWRSTRDTQPDSTPPTTAPSGIAAKSSAKASAALARPAERDVGHLREQRARHAEDHRDDVDDERHHQHRLGPQVAEAVDDRADAGRDRRAHHRQRRQADDGAEGREERDRVEQVEPGEADQRDQRAADERTGDAAGLHDGHVERVGRGQQLLVEDPRQQRGPGRLVDGEEGLLHGEEAQQQPHVLGAQRRLQPEAGAGEDEPDGRDHQQRAPVEDVGQRAAPQPEDHQRDEAEDAGQADVRRRAGHRVDLRGHRHDGQLGADDRDDVGQPEPAEVGVGERSGVRQQSPLHLGRLGRATGVAMRCPTSRSSALDMIAI